MTVPPLAILTNARSADQRSMIGYGELVLRAAQTSGIGATELRPASTLGRALPDRVQGAARKLVTNMDRFALTPLKLAGAKVDRPCTQPEVVLAPPRGKGAVAEG